jgi:hypothetical protein
LASVTCPKRQPGAHLSFVQSESFGPTAMSTIPLILIPLLEYSVPVALGLAFSLWLFKKKLTGDLVVSSGAPICLWLVLVLVFHGKSLSNAVIEPLILAGAILVLTLVRVAFDGRGIIGDKTLQTLNIVGSFLIALCIAFLIPSFPE